MGHQNLVKQEMDQNGFPILEVKIEEHPLEDLDRSSNMTKIKNIDTEHFNHKLHTNSTFANDKVRKERLSREELYKCYISCSEMLNIVIYFNTNKKKWNK